jgi:ADP-ribosylglycohydrolase
VGDALGTGIEFSPPGSFEPVFDIQGGGPFALEPGEWTDDTSMALCLAESLIERRSFDSVDQLGRYVRWWKDGHLSSNGRCFDIGGQTRAALTEHMATGMPFCGPQGDNAGNGSLMRLAPVAIVYAGQPAVAIANAAKSSRTTHGAWDCVDACRYFAGLLVGAINGASKQELVRPGYSPVPGLWVAEPLSPEVAKVAQGSFMTKKPPAIRGSGYVVDCLEAALWAFATTGSFQEAVLRAVNLGDDADTTGAVCGQIAGAFYGESAIPQPWRDILARRELLDSSAQQLVDLALEVATGRGG